MKYKRAFDLKIMIQMFIFGENQLLKIVAFHENKSPRYVRIRDLVAGRPKLYPLYTEKMTYNFGDLTVSQLNEISML